MKVVIASCLAFTISNMDKVNISIAIIPMAQEFGWSPSVTGLVQSAFFGGYLLMNVPGGYLASKLGGRRLLPFGVLIWSAATLVAPPAAASIPLLCVTRAFVGLGEAVAPTSITDMIARTVPKEERASAVSMAFAGLHVGSIVGMLAAPLLIESVGWPALFTTFGAAGFVWYVWFEQLMADIATHDPDVARKLVAAPSGSSPPSSRRVSSAGGAPPNVSGRSRAGDERLSSGGSLASRSRLASVDGASGSSSSSSTGGVASSSSGGSSAAGPATAAPPVPYRAFLRSSAVQALCFTHFANNYYHFTMLAWLPTYFKATMGVDLMHAAQTSLLPPIAGIACSIAAGRLADSLISSGTPVGVVRKLCQNIAFLGPVACMIPILMGMTVGNSTMDVGLVTAGLGLSAFSLAGLYCTHQDMSSKYAGAMLGLTNTSGAISGLVGVAATGTLFELTNGSWGEALLLPNVALLALGSFAYTLGAKNEPVDFDAADNTPFGFESVLKGPLAALSSATRPLVETISSTWETAQAKTLTQLRTARTLRRSLSSRDASLSGTSIEAAAAAAIAAVTPASAVTTPGFSPAWNDPHSESDGEEEGIQPELPLISWPPALAAILGQSDPPPGSAASAAIGRSRVLVAHWGLASICPDDDYDHQITDLDATYEDLSWDWGSEQEIQGQDGVGAWRGGGEAGTQQAVVVAGGGRRRRAPGPLDDAGPLDDEEEVPR